MKISSTISQIGEKNLGLKSGFIVLLLLIFLIPLHFVRNIINDRENRMEEAISSILQPLGGDMTLEGVAIALPFSELRESIETIQIPEKETLPTKELKGVEKKTLTKIDNYLVVLPKNYQVKVESTSSSLTRGIFTVPTYHGNLVIDADFELPSNLNSYGKGNVLRFQESIFLIGFLEKKNLTMVPKVSFNGQPLLLNEKPINFSKYFTSDVQYRIKNFSPSSGSFKMRCEFSFQGGKEMSLVPLSGDNHFTLSSDWKTPSFVGGWLPTERQINEKGFFAEWKIAGITTNWNPIMDYNETTRLATKGKRGIESITSEFFIPVGSYQKTDRSIKYALLFLFVPFFSIFLFEIFIRKRIHPFQYGLIGLANVVFYLLLLSISEHLSFNASFFISAVAVVILVSTYIGFIFKTIKWTAVIAGVQFLSYLFLFGTLQAEDYALLMGSIGLFVVIAILMFVTMKIDWYQQQE